MCVLSQRQWSSTPSEYLRWIDYATDIGVARGSHGAMLPKLSANVVIICFDRRYPKNYCCSSKIKNFGPIQKFFPQLYFGLATPLATEHEIVFYCKKTAGVGFHIKSINSLPHQLIS